VISLLPEGAGPSTVALATVEVAVLSRWRCCRGGGAVEVAVLSRCGAVIVVGGLAAAGVSGIVAR
jgi:hypothetical protein